MKDLTIKSCTPKPKECRTFSGAEISRCPTDRCVADASTNVCADKPKTCPDFDGALLQHCPQEACNLNITARTCRAKPPACSTFETKLDFCPKDRCVVDFIKRACLPKTCGGEKVTLKEKDVGPYVTDKYGRRHVKYVLPLGTSNGAVSWDLSAINFHYDYYPFYQVTPDDGQCPIQSFQLLREDGTAMKSTMVGTGTTGRSLSLDTSVVGTYRFLLQASTKGGVRSPKVAVTMGVCRENSLSAAQQVISRVIDRYSTNIYDATTAMPNVHRIEFYKWRDLFKNACGSCQPRFQIVSSDKVQFQAPIWFDANDNLLIKTTEGLRVKGYIKVFFSDKHCERISQPVYVPFKFEICGQERVSIVNPTASLTQKFMMGIDKDVELTFEDLRAEFRTDSEHCKVQSFQVVTEYGGVYYDLSPNLASRFYTSQTGIRLINYLGAPQDLTVYIKAFSTGKSVAYKPLKISYVRNSAPSIGGDISQNLVEVKEGEDNTGKTQDFNLYFKDREGNRVVKYDLSPSLDNTAWVKHKIIGETDNIQGLQFRVYKERVTPDINGKHELKVTVWDEFGERTRQSTTLVVPLVIRYEKSAVIVDPIPATSTDTTTKTTTTDASRTDDTRSDSTTAASTSTSTTTTDPTTGKTTTTDVNTDTAIVKAIEVEKVLSEEK